MKNFGYVSARTVDEAVEALATAKGPARPLAGGTDLIVQLQEGRRTVDRVVDVKRIPATTRIDTDEEGNLRVGAAVPLSTIYSNPTVRSRYPILVAGTSLIGSVQIQNRATLGGNLCNAAPSADAIPALICLDAEAIVAGPEGTRRVPVTSFCTGPGQTVLQEGELLVEILIPPAKTGMSGYYLRFIPRNEMDIAVAGAGVTIQVDPKTGRCTDARIVLAAVAPTPVRVETAEAVLIGSRPDADILDQAGDLAAEAARPIDDVRGSADYRRHLVKVLTQRALSTCIDATGA